MPRFPASTLVVPQSSASIMDSLGTEGVRRQVMEMSGTGHMTTVVSLGDSGKVYCISDDESGNEDWKVQLSKEI